MSRKQIMYFVIESLWKKSEDEAERAVFGSIL
jgi:hypothetical protein